MLSFCCCCSGGRDKFSKLPEAFKGIKQVRKKQKQHAGTVWHRLDQCQLLLQRARA